MMEFARAAFPWILIALLVAVVCARMDGEKK